MNVTGGWAARAARGAARVVKYQCTSTVFFFFQAEDGIRDHCVTGVQTCALPICRDDGRWRSAECEESRRDDEQKNYDDESWAGLHRELNDRNSRRAGEFVRPARFDDACFGRFAFWNRPDHRKSKCRNNQRDRAFLADHAAVCCSCRRRLLLAHSFSPLMNRFAERLAADRLSLRHTRTEVLQVNVGKICNLTCVHCHVNAGPKRKEIMTRETIDRIIEWLAKTDIPTVDLTGGAPEMIPDFRYLIERVDSLQPHRHIIDAVISRSC